MNHGSQTLLGHCDEDIFVFLFFVVVIIVGGLGSSSGGRGRWMLCPSSAPTLLSGRPHYSLLINSVTKVSPPVTVKKTSAILTLFGLDAASCSVCAKCNFKDASSASRRMYSNSCSSFDASPHPRTPSNLLLSMEHRCRKTKAITGQTTVNLIKSLHILSSNSEQL